MKRLHRMIVRAFIGPLVVTFAVVLFILVMQFLWKYVDDLMGKGLEWHVLAELLTYATASFVPLALPLAVLLSSIMTLGGLGENSELVPMRSAGLGLPRILAPLAVFAVLVAGFSFFFSNNVLPVAELKFRSLLWDVTRKKPALNLRPGVFYTGIDGLSIRVMDKDERTGLLHDVLIYDHRAPQQANRTVVRARFGTMRRGVDGRHLLFTLRDGRFYDEHSPGGRTGGNHPMVHGTFAEDELRIDLSGLGLDRTDQDLFKDHYKMLTMGQLLRTEDSLRAKMRDRHEEQERHLRGGLHPLRDDSLAAARLGHHVPGLPANAGPPGGFHDVAAQMARNNAGLLQRWTEERRGREEQIARFGIEAHRKPMLAVACLVFFLIGAPLGAIIRRGGMGLPVIFAIVFFLVFHIISFSTEKLVVAGELAPWPGMWAGILVLLPIGLLLTWKAATDSPLLDADAYYRGWERLRSRFRRPHADPPTV